MAATEPELGSGSPKEAADASTQDASPQAGSAQTGSRTRKRTHRRSRRFRIVLLVVVWVIVIYLAVAAVFMLLGIRDASRAMQDLQRAKAELTSSEIVSTQPEIELSQARQQFVSASGLLDSPFLGPATILPIIGRQVTSVRDLAHAATQVSGIGVHALSELRSVLNAPHKSGAARVLALQHLATLASVTNAQLGTVNPGPSQSLLSPLAKRYNDFVNELNLVRTRLSHASSVAGSLGQMLKGPSQYLLLVANNAEMRAGSGMFLEAGTLSIDDGHIKLGHLVDTGTIPVPEGAVPIGGDLAARWGWLKPSQDWRNLALSPEFPQTAPVAVAMWQAVEHQHVDGVITIDVAALQALLEVTGPVTLTDGTVVSSSNVVELLLHDEYENLTFASTNAQVARESRLGSLAQATLEAVQSRSLDLNTLANAMSDVTSGRHIMLWSSSTSAEQSWIESGVGGQLSSNSLLAAVVNRSGAKLDQYLSVRCSLSVETVSGGSDGTLAVTLTNQTPPGQSPYIAGPYPHLGTVYGEYVGFVAVNLPADASPHFFATGATGPPVAWGAEGPVWVLAVPVDVKAGADQTVVVHFTMPGVHGSMTVEPSARIPSEQWSYRGQGFTDGTSYSISW